VIDCFYFKDPEKMGFWARDICGSSYLFSNALVFKLKNLLVKLGAFCFVRELGTKTTRNAAASA